ncbi:hypothetical protein KOW79_021710 [Hemibagrus wyckioides]|uniref:Ig-like domain-containing protein n=1 Tax=Hemibagrus wyckioides TaxID=337641 RepID=A0A9D3S8C6_9TELE|nr:hypothetical protein KOW79_021710 [Hemibagrus wyckioides]
MLPALCSLFTVLSCVSGVSVVTQKPPVLTLTPGQTATMDCNLGTVNNDARCTSLQSLLYLLVTPLISSLSTRVPSHTDTMLPALCSLFTVLSCVSGVTVVTQKPPVLTLTPGQTATMDCNLGTVQNSGRWYKQVPGGVPHTSLQSLLYLLVTLLISSLSTRVPSHTDTMLPALCSLFTALSCVSGVTVVTQKPPVLTLTPGQTATMDCNLGTVTNEAACWYKQIPAGVPQHVIRNYHGWSSPRYDSGFSSPKFTSTHSSKSDDKLIISNVEVGDSAVYYCQTWDSSAKENVSQ